MDVRPLISVFMPCYNHGRYVARAIESVLAQTYQNFEFIVVENASTDDSKEVIERYKDRITKIIYNTTNNLNVWVEQTDVCRGKYIALMCADDYWLPEKLEKQVEVINQGSEACFCWSRYFDTESGELKDKLYAQDLSIIEWIRYFGSHENCLSLPTALIEKNLYMEAISAVSQFYQVGDWNVWLYLLKRGKKIDVVQEELCFMGRHAGNASAITDENNIRTLNEERNARRQFLLELPKELFIKAFQSDFLIPEAWNEEEIACERLALLYRLEENGFGDWYVTLDYYYQLLGSKDTENLLKRGKYRELGRKMYELSGKYGVEGIVANIERIQREAELGAAVPILKNVVEKIFYYCNFASKKAEIRREIINLCIQFMEESAWNWGDWEKCGISITRDEAADKWRSWKENAEEVDIASDVLPFFRAVKEFFDHFERM